MGQTARLFYDDSETDSDLYYLTGFLAGDPFLLLECAGRRTLFLSDLEVDRARPLAGPGGRIHEVVRLEEITERIKKDHPEPPAEPVPRVGLHVLYIARDRGITALDVPARFPVGLADVVRGHGIGVHWRPSPFVPERTVKTKDEIARIREAIRHTEAAIEAGIDRIRGASIRGSQLEEGGVPLTSEAVRATIARSLLERNCFCPTIIVAGGEQGCDPHERGHGPLPAHMPIILDVFPRHLGNRYHGDLTRTVVRGRASGEARRMFDAVKEAKARAEGMLKEGIDGFDVHAAVRKTFDDAGFETGLRGGRNVGFFHGTGHGLGLDVHELPRLSRVHEVMREGHVVTVEPGLYYPGVGGVRLEDDVLVTAGGCENLGSLGCEFEV